MISRGSEVPVGVGACQSAPSMGKCSEARLWEQLGVIGSAVAGVFPASVWDQQLAKGLAVIPTDWLLC